jgi:pyrroline-5-carboxylate reductase
LEEVSENLSTIKLLMGAIGGVDILPESLMNAAGAVSGSGPAYVSTG